MTPYNRTVAHRISKHYNSHSDVLAGNRAYVDITFFLTQDDSILTFLTHCGRVTQICVFNTVKLGTSASSP